MIAVDTNILVYAHRQDSTWHDLAYQRLKELAEGSTAWAIPWPCIHEFFSISTHPLIYSPPTPLEKAIDQIDAWLESPTVILLTETERYWDQLREALTTGRVSGPQVHDAKIAALCQAHGIKELWSADRDFGRFASLKVKNPLVV